MRDQAGFDLWAGEYDKYVGLSEAADTYPFAGYREVLGDIYNEIMSVKGARVLDLGFGTGTLTNKLYEGGCEVFGQDFSEKMIELAQKKMPEAFLLQGDFYQGIVPELKEQTYDFIVGTYSMHHLTDEDKVHFFKEALSLLKPGGKFLIGDVCFETEEDLKQASERAGDEWDSDEYYIVCERLRRDFPNLTFEKKSFCAGIITLLA
jgi:putative AdoMet-dependent methyltransferase